jgi:alkaline phosphatase
MIVIAALIFVATLIAGRFAPWEVSWANLVLRSQNGMKHSYPPPAAGASVVPSVASGEAIEIDPRPRNIVLVIGDGMGVGQVSTASTLIRGPYGRITLESAPVVGLMKTHAGNVLVTDSAASATAMATGYKAPKKAISKLPDGSEPVTIFEAVRAAGLVTGVVTTSGLVDATPAGFTAHAEKREHYPEILSDMLASDTELLIGGDWSDYRKALRNAEFQEMLARADELGDAAGYQVVRDLSAMTATNGRVLALFPPRDRGGDAHGPELDVVARFALDRLAAHDTGFVLLIESELTDGTGHDNDVAALVDGVRELDTAVAAVLDWAAPRGDTLVVVTADHDTGGLGIVDGAYDETDAELRWATDGHTAQWVPVFAFGPGAELFDTVIDNTDIGLLFAKLLEIEDFPRRNP